MGNRALAVRTAMAAAALAACTPAGEELAARGQFPGEWYPRVQQEGRGTEPPAFMAWLFRTEDCLTCDSFDYAVRRSQAALPDAVPLVAVHVGSRSAEQVPRSFFTARRVRVDRYVTVSPREFRRLAGRSALPSIVLVKDGRIEWTSAMPQGISSPSELEAMLRTFGRTGGLDGGSSPGQPSPEGPRFP